VTKTGNAAGTSDAPAAGGGSAGPNGQGTAPGGLRAASERIDQLILAIDRDGDKDLRMKVEEAVRLVIELYGSGLAQAFEIVAQEGNPGAPLLARFSQDPLLGDLIAFHRIDLAALTAARPEGEGGGKTATGGRNLRATGDRIEELVRHFAGVQDVFLKDHAEEVVRLLVDLYGEALARTLEIVDEGGEEVWGLFDRFTADELVRTLLILHDLHPSDLDTRIREAIEKVRPYLKSHGGGVEVLSLDEDGVLLLRLQGSCEGCPSSTLTVKLALERAIKEAAPEVTEVRAEGVAERDPANQGLATPAAALSAGIEANTSASRGGGGLLQIGKRPPSAAAPAPPAPAEVLPDWAELDSVTAGVAVGQVARLTLGGAAIVVCRVAEDLYAYRDRCPGCGSAVGGGELHEASLACPGCGRVYDVRLAGRCFDVPGLHLDPLPLLAEDGTVRVAVGAAAR
jgi:Fe-S cluster biogenesis protein NfuA/nitrite reductase/ring-hydroxylating ferredoxin subunit